MRYELHEHISRLLFDHDCVVVPGFGAFLIRYHSAEINEATHMMRPPSKRVYFNKSIIENDGLLAKSISLTEGVSYKEALQYIDKESTRYQDDLKLGKKLNLHGVGRLVLNDDSNVQFTPSLEINYLFDSFGLSIFRSSALQREEVLRQSINKVIEKHIHEKPVKQRKRNLLWAAVLGPVAIAAAIGYSVLSGSGVQNNQNWAGFNFMQLSQSASETVIEKEPVTSETINITEENITAIAEDIVAPANNIEEPTTAEEVTTIHLGDFHIVVGSFKDDINANKLITKLKSKGYDAYTADGDSRYKRVAIGNYGSEAEAEEALKEIKKNVHPQSWIYNN